jgi:hypothetical protein
MRRLWHRLRNADRQAVVTRGNVRAGVSFSGSYIALPSVAITYSDERKVELSFRVGTRSYTDDFLALWLMWQAPVALHGVLDWLLPDPFMGTGWNTGWCRRTDSGSRLPWRGIKDR